MVATRPYDEIISFLASGASPAAIVAFKPSSQLQSRVSDLLFREKNERLTAEEKSELDHYLVLEHIMRLAKIRARRLLA
jgi:hypothetical protein